MGINSVFDAGQADLSDLFEMKTPQKISEARHKVFLNVTEFGCEVAPEAGEETEMPYFILLLIYSDIFNYYQKSNPKSSRRIPIASSSRPTAPLFLPYATGKTFTSLAISLSPNCMYFDDDGPQAITPKWAVSQ